MNFFFLLPIFFLMGVIESFCVYGFKKWVFTFGPKVFKGKIKFHSDIEDLMTRLSDVEYEILNDTKILFYGKGKSSLRGTIIRNSVGEIEVVGRVNVGLTLFLCSAASFFIVILGYEVLKGNLNMLFGLLFAL